jgi:hypothetical protein
MKKTNSIKFLGMIAIAAGLFLASCSKEGPAGPAGAAGADGATGATGAPGPSAKLYDFSLTFDSTSGTATTLGGNYRRYQGITGVDTAKDVVLLYNVYVSSTSGIKYYFGMPNVSNGVAYNYYYYRNTTSTTGAINLVCSIEDPLDGTINPIGVPSFVDKFRAVVIKATAKVPFLDYSNYNAVKAFYNLKD